METSTRIDKEIVLGNSFPDFFEKKTETFLDL